MKKTKLNLLIFSLLMLIMGACGVKKTYTHDLFGGGFSGNKPVQHASEKSIEKKSPLNTENIEKCENKNSLQHQQTGAKQHLYLKESFNYLPAIKCKKKPANVVSSGKRKYTENNNGNDNPKILTQARNVFFVSASMILLGSILTAFKSYIAANIGAILLAIGFILLCIAFIMALTGWLNKLKKNKSSQKITFGHVLLGLILLGLVTAIVVLSTSEGSGWYK